MTTRERFVRVMRDFDTSVETMRWEFGYWGGTINRWYREGLPQMQPAKVPRVLTTPSSSIYTTSWTCRNRYVAPGEYPNGYAIMGGIPKLEIAGGRDRVDEILAPVPEVLASGGYIPYADHFIPPEVDLESFTYYRQKLNRMIADAVKK